MIDYIGNCTRAVINQDLVEVMVVLAMNDIPFRLDQTGGYCMVVNVYRKSDDLELGIIVDDGWDVWQVDPNLEEDEGRRLCRGTHDEVIGKIAEWQRS